MRSLALALLLCACSAGPTEVPAELLHAAPPRGHEPIRVRLVGLGPLETVSVLEGLRAWRDVSSAGTDANPSPNLGYEVELLDAPPATAEPGTVEVRMAASLPDPGWLGATYGSLPGHARIELLASGNPSVAGRIAAHELGHALGLAHCEGGHDSVMYHMAERMSDLPTCWDAKVLCDLRRCDLEPRCVTAAKLASLRAEGGT